MYAMKVPRINAQALVDYATIVSEKELDVYRRIDHPFVQPQSDEFLT
jgi:hypothetical protein